MEFCQQDNENSVYMMIVKYSIFILLWKIEQIII
jgi:hypothetical protein